MCHFLTITVPGRAVPEVPKEYRRKVHFVEQTNRSVTEFAPPDWISFIAISGGCSCDFYRTPHDTPENRSNLKQKYQKRGWSEAKIHRALESQKDAPTRCAGLRDDIRDLVTNLTNELGEIRLSLHWYSGDVETEDFILDDVGCVSVADFRRDTTALREETTLTIQGAPDAAGQPATRPESK